MKFTRIDTLKEKEKMFLILKKRLDKLVKEEKQNGDLKPELRETISTMNSLLKEIRIDSSGTQETSQELRERVFGNWIKKVKGDDAED